MYMIAEDWTPSDASDYISLDWNYGDQNVKYGMIVQTILLLTVSPNIKGITNFNFNITIYGTDYFVPDLNHNGLVDIYDIVIVTSAYGATPSSTRWNAAADINRNNRVDAMDVLAVVKDYGQAAL